MILKEDIIEKRKSANMFHHALVPFAERRFLKMKYLIWGTGQCAQATIEDYLLSYFEQNPILAFIDNSITKTDKEFWGQKIISPNMINNYDYDAILICSSFEKEIRKQLNEELKIPENYILSLKDFHQNIVTYYKNTYKLQEKEILLIGSQEEYNRIGHLYKAYFHIAGFVDMKHLKEIKNFNFDCIMLTNMKNLLSSNEGKTSLELEKALTNQLLNDYQIITKNILYHSIYKAFAATGRRISYGEENPDKTFLVIQLSSYAGLGSILISVACAVAYAKEYNYIPVVDMMTYKTQYLTESEVNHVNAWDKFFEQPAGYKLQDIQNSKNIIICTTRENDFYNKANFNFLKPNKKLLEQTNHYIQHLFTSPDKRVLGVLFRGTDYSNLKPYGHRIQPDINMMITTVKEKLNQWGEFDTIYLCTEVEDAVYRFKEEFPGKIECYPQKRLPASYNQYLATQTFFDENDVYTNAADYFIVLSALSKCTSLIAGSCSGTSYAQLVNNHHYENEYIFSLGSYGIDEKME